MNFIIRLLLSPNINFVKVKKRVIKSLSIYYILLNSLLIQIKLYRYIDIYYLKLLQHLVGAIVRSFLKNILPWPRVPPLLLDAISVQKTTIAQKKNTSYQGWKTIVKQERQQVLQSLQKLDNRIQEDLTSLVERQLQDV